MILPPGPRMDSACFGAAFCAVLLPPYATPRLNAARFAAIDADVRATLYCATPAPLHCG